MEFLNDKKVIYKKVSILINFSTAHTIITVIGNNGNR